MVTMPNWWYVALPALTVVVVIVAGLFANVKILCDIRKAQLEIKKLHSDFEAKQSRIFLPSEADIRKYGRNRSNDVGERLSIPTIYIAERLRSFGATVAAVAREVASLWKLRKTLTNENPLTGGLSFGLGITNSYA